MYARIHQEAEASEKLSTDLTVNDNLNSSFKFGRRSLGDEQVSCKNIQMQIELSRFYITVQSNLSYSGVLDALVFGINNFN